MEELNTKRLDALIHRIMPEDAQEYLRKRVSKIINNLEPERQKEMFIGRFGLIDDIPKTLEETGKEFDVTRERVRQVEAKLSEKIRKELGFYN